MLDWLFDSDRRLLIASIVIVVAVIAFSIVAAVADEKAWNEYAAAHHCIGKGTKHGQLSSGLGTSSEGNAVVVTTTTPDQTIYVCDGGEIQIR